MGKVYFVRHGESKANVEGKFAGQKENSELTDKGREQARQAAKNLISKKISVHKIISSPLVRAHETAKIIVSTSKLKLEINIDHRIAEYDMGSLTGTPIRKVTSKELTSAENAENPHEFMKRVHELLDELYSSDTNTLVVSHAGVGRIITAKKKNADPFSFYDLDPYPNAEIIELN